MAPMIRGRKGEYRKEFAELLKNVFLPARQGDGANSSNWKDDAQTDKKIQVMTLMSWSTRVVREGMVAAPRRKVSRTAPLRPGAGPLRCRIMPISKRARNRAERITYSANFRLPRAGFHDLGKSSRACSRQQPVRRLPGPVTGLGQTSWKIDAD